MLLRKVTRLRLPTRHLLAQSRHCSTGGGRQGAEVDLSEVRQLLARHGGGSVELSMDDGTGLASLRLNHVEKKNALSGAMMCQLEEAVGELERWPRGRGLLLHADGDTFCSGGDLDTVRALCRPGDGGRMSAFMQSALARLSDLPLVTVAVVSGRALGGGAELTLAADFRVWSAAGQLRFVQARMGLLTGWGGGARLARLVGPRAALDLLLSCRPVGAEDALRLGLADGPVVPPDVDPLQHARQWLEARVAHDPSVVRAVKKMIVNTRGDLTDLWRKERELFDPLWGGEANRRALGENIKH
ncbi:ethylmalonyl-CoA decarboxylase-like isoform X2 [Amphibalanus amphitrite]|nr:ethylmalonyl-CoA decarboxylase-like isoform X2 [Amphibalanus amphitrite]XP_043190021.1 ethylmalonyl-CoA decarboxylase-like isoform X2 [Amphibalanus amphitrite]XP_043194949.1 ethylmalonyl-CoA decarboxylase-like isoform X2 [Amphibalanus amphitrite]XP_043194950.1 ethylmalonyl-CoA decarboxylase-like isoform X2 [Amphibalanus amphitrite]